MSAEKIEEILPHWAVNSASFSVITTDLEGKYTFINENFKKRFAWMKMDFMGQPFGITVHPEDHEKCNQAAVECMTNPGKIISLKIRKPMNREGIHQWTHWEFSSLQDKDDNLIGIFALGYDISELKIFAAESLIAKFKLNDIAHIQSHQVRAPLASILGLINLLLDESDPKTNEVYLTRLQESAQQLDEIIHKIVGLTKS